MLRAISTRARNGWMLLALLPGAMLQARYDGASAFSNLVGALLFAAVIDTAVALLRKRSASLLRDQCVLLNAALVALWLPITLPLWAIASAVLAATLLACMFDGRQSGSPFHAAMVGCAFALLIVPHALAPPRNDTTPVWIATAYASAGIALVVGRCIRWQVPLGMLAGAGIIALSSRFVGGLQMHAIPIELLPVFALTTFFVATDASSGCVLPRARLLF